MLFGVDAFSSRSCGKVVGVHNVKLVQVAQVLEGCARLGSQAMASMQESLGHVDAVVSAGLTD